MTIKSMIQKEPLAALFAGSLVGAGAGLLFAPRSGRQTRQQIADFAGSVKGSVECYASRARDKVVSAAGKGRDFIVGGKDLLASSIDAGWKAYRRQRQRLAKML